MKQAHFGSVYEPLLWTIERMAAARHADFMDDPTEIEIYPGARGGAGPCNIRAHSVRMEGMEVHFGPGSDCPNILDHRTGERRPGTLQDIVEGIRLCDALPNIDFIMSW